MVVQEYINGFDTYTRIDTTYSLKEKRSDFWSFVCIVRLQKKESNGRLKIEVVYNI